ncbi:MAG TPA: hypothetical protein VHL80_08650 [Polyangia bacterium]|nr:hypothetical protein [Polyangia bacterium]
MRAAVRVLAGAGALFAWAAAARAESPPAPKPGPATEPQGAAPATPPAAPPAAAAAAAPASDTAPRAIAAKTFPRLKPPTMVHYQQFGIALLSGSGYRAIFPYQNQNGMMINCGQANKTICTGRLPTFLDVQPSFGFADHWDVLLDLRFGLEQDFTATHELAVAPGVRYWVDPEESAKFFATLQVAYDVTTQHVAGLAHNDDVALRNSNGFMLEVMRNLGVYLQFGETIGFVRWLRFEIDAGLGVQARLP